MAAILPRGEGDELVTISRLSCSKLEKVPYDYRLGANTIIVIIVVYDIHPITLHSGM